MEWYEAEWSSYNGLKYWWAESRTDRCIGMLPSGEYEVRDMHGVKPVKILASPFETLDAAKTAYLLLGD